MRRLLLAAGSVLLASAGAVSGAAAQPAAAPASAVAVKPVDAAERAQVVTELAKTLEANFVFPEVGVKYAAMCTTRSTRRSNRMRVSRARSLISPGTNSNSSRMSLTRRKSARLS